MLDYTVEVLVVEDGRSLAQQHVGRIRSEGYSVDAVCCYPTLKDWLEEGNIPRYVLMDYDLMGCTHQSIPNGYEGALLIRDMLGEDIFIHLFTRRFELRMPPDEPDESWFSLCKNGPFDAYGLKNINLALRFLAVQKDKWGS